MAELDLAALRRLVAALQHLMAGGDIATLATRRDCRRLVAFVLLPL